MADFTTWTAFYAALLDAIANRDPAVKQYRRPDGTLVEFNSPAEMIDYAARVKPLADAETATSGSASRRAHATGQGDSW
jgi:hypothetical protein